MKKLLLAILLLAFVGCSSAPTRSSSTNPGETYILYGVGTGHSAESGPTETKIIGGGYREEFMWGTVHQFEAGYFNDSSGNPNRKSSAWFSYSVGVEVDAHPILLRLTVGPALLTTPDGYLGGHFQFNNDVFAGVRDKRGRSIGVCYKHMSSAGIEMPNVGRDFLPVLQASFPW